MKIFTIISLFVYSLFAGEFSQKVAEFSDNLFNQANLAPNSQLAVLPFDIDDKVENKSLGTAFAEFLISEIFNNQEIELVDRENIKNLLEEMAFSNSTLSNEGEVIEMGHFTSADYLVLGKVASLGGHNYISARVVTTKDGTIIGTSQTSFLVTATDKAVTNLYAENSYVRESAFRSLLIPGLGQAYSNEKGHAILAASLCGAGVAATVTTGVIYNLSKTEFNNYHALLGTPAYKDEQQNIMDELGVTATEADSVFTVRHDEKQDDYLAKKQIFTISAAVTGGLWALNVVDAIFMGKRAEKKFKLYFSANPFTNSFGAQVALNF